MITIPTFIVVPFVIGFLIGYSAVKLFRIFYLLKTADELKIGSGMMSGYAWTQEQSKNWFDWLFASASGFLNLIIFTFLLEAVKKLL